MSEKKTAIMTGESQSERHAMIAVRWDEVFPELVIEHCDKESLRQLIAAPRVVGIGISSYEAAVAASSNRSSGNPDSIKTREKTVVAREDDGRVLQLAGQRPRQRVGLQDTRRLVYALLQHLIAAGVLIFYSKSVMGAALRACIGA